MQLSTDLIQRLILDPGFETGVVTDWAGDYGEPGYEFRYGAETPMLLIGNWWCRCGNNPKAGTYKWGYPVGPEGETPKVLPTDLHSVDDHHPRVWAQLASQGVETAFYDEWWIDPNTSKAYRTQADSYSWQSSIQWNEDIGDYMTPDDDFQTWLDWVLNDPERRALMRDWLGPLKDAGFVQWEPDDPHRYENGWHPHQTDDPKTVTATIRRTDPDCDIVYVIDETSQFYIGFSAWTRPDDYKED
jgi:hypothetical protein